jgi:superfamily II DNA or RNA helicase
VNSGEVSNTRPGTRQRAVCASAENGRVEQGPDPEGESTELVRLREENARLRALLGIDERTGDGHAVAWSPTLLSNPELSPAIDAGSSNAAKLKVFRSFFGARSDVYAVRWENVSTGKTGWSPATRGGSFRPRRSRPEYLPLTDDVLASHLRGEATIGIYPLLRGDNCTLLACDFDKGTWVLDALAYMDACYTHGVPAALERSRSGNGGHVWIFFTVPVPASDARALGAALLREAMAARAEMDLSSYDRFFPSQDFLPKAGFGNLIALPFQGRSARAGNTVFLDPKSLEPYEDQWAFLSSVARLGPDAVSQLAATLRPVNAGPAVSFAELARQGGPPPPPVIRGQLTGRLSIERSGLPPAILAALKHLSSIANPEFYEKQRMRFSTWNTPRFITCYSEDLEWLHLPRGLTEQVTNLLDELGSRLDLDDRRTDPDPIDIHYTATLRTQQAAAVADLTAHDRGVLVAPPGAGKTVMACAVIAHHQTPTLVLVDRKELVEQWRTRLSEHLNIDPTQIGQIGGGTDRPSGIVDVAMLQSLARRDDPTVFDRYGLVVVDECHHIPAASFASCVERARSRRWLGLTATPYRRDKLEAIIGFHCGRTRHEITPGSVAGAELVRRELIVHTTGTEVEEEDTAHIQAVFAALVDDDRRTAQICADVSTAIGQGRTCLVLTQRTDHIDAIVAGLDTLGVHALVLKGGLGKKARVAVSDAITSRSPEEGIVLVATGSYLGEGFDWPELDTLFLAFPLAFKGRVVQYVGRLLRTHDTKHHVELHDYVDVRVPVLDRMHTKRLPAYATLGFDTPGGAARRKQRHPATGTHRSS